MQRVVESARGRRHKSLCHLRGYLHAVQFGLNNFAVEPIPSHPLYVIYGQHVSLQGDATVTPLFFFGGGETPSQPAASCARPRRTTNGYPHCCPRPFCQSQKTPKVSDGWCNLACTSRTLYTSVGCFSCFGASSTPTLPKSSEKKEGKRERR